MILDNSHKLPELVGLLGKDKNKDNNDDGGGDDDNYTSLNTKQLMYRTKGYTTFKMIFKKRFKWHCKKLLNEK